MVEKIRNPYTIKLKLSYCVKKIIAKSDFLIKQWIKLNYKIKLKSSINFNKTPRTFNEKIQFRKIYYENSLYPICADKFSVRKYVAQKIGEEYLIPLLFSGTNITVEDFKKIPNQFVIKHNHNSGPVTIVYDKNKIDLKRMCKIYNKGLKYDYGILSNEKWYSAIEPKIIIEKLMLDKGKIPKDYKFHVFNKSNKMFVMLDIDRFENHKRKIYDEEWTDLELSLIFPYSEKKFIRPKEFTKLKEITKKLSEDFEYVRVDLFLINRKIYFGELTFGENSGFGRFSKKEWDEKFGNYWGGI